MYALLTAACFCGASPRWTKSTPTRPRSSDKSRKKSTSRILRCVGMGSLLCMASSFCHRFSLVKSVRLSFCPTYVCTYWHVYAAFASFVNTWFSSLKHIGSLYFCVRLCMHVLSVSSPDVHAGGSKCSTHRDTSFPCLSAAASLRAPLSPADSIQPPPPRPAPLFFCVLCVLCLPRCLVYHLLPDCLHGGRFDSGEPWILGYLA